MNNPTWVVSSLRSVVAALVGPALGWPVFPFSSLGDWAREWLVKSLKIGSPPWRMANCKERVEEELMQHSV